MHVQDVIDLADRKYGGLEGFQQIQNKRRSARAKRQANKDAASYEAEQARIAAAPAREQALQASLARHGLQVERGFRLYKDYLRKGSGDPDQVAEQAAELKWLFNNTDVRMRMTRVSSHQLTTCSYMHLTESSGDYACTGSYVRAGSIKHSQQSLRG